MKLSFSVTLLSLFFLFTTPTSAQTTHLIFKHISYDTTQQKWVLLHNGKTYDEKPEHCPYSVDKFTNHITGTTDGLQFNFQVANLNGWLYYGFYNYTDGRYPQPVYFNTPAKITNGKVFVSIRQLSGVYDMVDWEHHGTATLGYRIVRNDGTMLYDGLVSFSGKDSFIVEPTIIDGPFVGKLSPSSCTVSFRTTVPVKTTITLANKTITESKAITQHEITISNLQPQTNYSYTIHYGNLIYTSSFTTAPLPADTNHFVFAYVSDSRNGMGGGERNIYGTNAYMMKKIMALAAAEKVGFVQFTGDLINGYTACKESFNLQMANWKHAIQPFAQHIPVYVAMGNHESYITAFKMNSGHYPVSIPHLPLTETSESLFAKSFVLPDNGPVSEDGSALDADKTIQNFPSYSENVYSYTYGNTAVIVLNSNYLYSPTQTSLPDVGGNVHGYVMDNQLAWLKTTLQNMENDKNINHIFVTIHTPFFPNGGHSHNAMWYHGNNAVRAIINGKKAEKGIIERRDQLLDLLVNQSTKVRAILTGDEHNYNRLKICNETPRYPKNWKAKKLSLSRTIWQINNGAAGAPYYAQEHLPWTKYDYAFSTQNAIVLIHINGKKIQVIVKNPDTLDLVDSFDLIK